MYDEMFNVQCYAKIDKITFGILKYNFFRTYNANSLEKT